MFAYYKRRKTPKCREDLVIELSLGGLPTISCQGHFPENVSCGESKNLTIESYITVNIRTMKSRRTVTLRADPLNTDAKGGASIPSEYQPAKV